MEQSTSAKTIADEGVVKLWDATFLSEIKLLKRSTKKLKKRHDAFKSN